jgi:predicted nucleic acid-binding protein
MRAGESWLFTVPYLVRALDRRPQQRERRVSARGRIVTGWPGCAGAVSLAVATPATDRLLGEEDCAISVITVSELLPATACARGARGVRRRAFVEGLLAGLDPLPVDEPVARVHADVWADLAARGEAVGALWIVATALAHGLGVATRNAGDFARVPGLRVVAVA